MKMKGISGRSLMLFCTIVNGLWYYYSLPASFVNFQNKVAKAERQYKILEEHHKQLIPSYLDNLEKWRAVCTGCSIDECGINS
jgi:hypothetical protein